MLQRKFGPTSLQVSALGFGVRRLAGYSCAVPAVTPGPLPDAERPRWEKALAPNAREWAGEV